jgi:hypothetical protein
MPVETVTAPGALRWRFRQREVGTTAADETRTPLWTAARHVTCATQHAPHLDRAQLTCRERLCAERSRTMRLPTAILPARAEVEAPDQVLDWGSDPSRSKASA